MADKQAPAVPLPRPSDVPQVDVPSGISLAALKDLRKLLVPGDRYADTTVDSASSANGKPGHT